MCERCGCDRNGPVKRGEEPPHRARGRWHVHADGTAHSHPHDQEHVHAPPRDQGEADQGEAGHGSPVDLGSRTVAHAARASVASLTSFRFQR